MKEKYWGYLSFSDVFATNFQFKNESFKDYVRRVFILKQETQENNYIWKKTTLFLSVVFSASAFAISVSMMMSGGLAIIPGLVIIFASVFSIISSLSTSVILQIVDALRFAYSLSNITSANFMTYKSKIETAKIENITEEERKYLFKTEYNKIIKEYDDAAQDLVKNGFYIN